MTDTTAPHRRIEYMLLADVPAADSNAKAHSMDALGASVQAFGFIEPCVLDERSGQLLGGHGRIDYLAELEAAGGGPPPEGVMVDPDTNLWLVPVVRGVRSRDADHARAMAIALNRVGERGGWNVEQLGADLDVLADTEWQDAIGWTSDELDDLIASTQQAGPAEHVQPVGPIPGAPTLADRFLVPPFTVLDARQGYWQDRKRAWLSLGIRSEEGRAHNLLKMSDTVLEAQAPNRSTPTALPYASQSMQAKNNDRSVPNRSVPSNHSGNDPAYFWKKQAAEAEAGRELSNAEFEADWYTADAYVGGTSIFDPVLCEVAYRWWSPPGGLVIDPFAGGSVRGVTAAWLGRRYIGFDLRAEQTASNAEQWQAIGARHPGTPGEVEWRTGDSLALLPEVPAATADLVFSCPPYFDLERYSDDPADLSNAGSYEQFLTTYADIINRAAATLADDRFAVWVVGDIRGEDGSIRGLIPDTIRAFEAAGMQFHNDAILVTAIGSLALRAARVFSGARRLARAHQYVLVFAKGDPRRAVEACGPVEVADPADLFGTLAE